MIFTLSTIVFTLLNFLTFIKKDNISVIYYNTQIDPTDNISFYNYSYRIAFLGTCDKNNDIFSELFEYDLKYVIKDNLNLIYEKNNIKIGFHKCNHSDFFNKTNKVMDLMGIKDSFYCFNDSKMGINGIYTDETFSYIELTIKAKYLEEDNYDKYYKLLTTDDCKIKMFFLLTSIDMNNYNNQINYSLFELFLEISPVNYLKRNIFYKVYRFDSSENFLFDIYN